VADGIGLMIVGLAFFVGMYSGEPHSVADRTVGIITIVIYISARSGAATAP
jgi:hypothetical protein